MGSAKKRRRRIWLLFLIPVVLLAAGFGLPRISVCPRCFSTDTAPIKYGFVASEMHIEAVMNHEYVLGGCMIERDSPARHCFNCGSKYGFELLNLLFLLLSIPAAVLSALTIGIVLLTIKIRARRTHHG